MHLNQRSQECLNRTRYLLSRLRSPPLFSISANAFLKGVGVLGVVSNKERLIFGVLNGVFFSLHKHKFCPRRHCGYKNELTKQGHQVLRCKCPCTAAPTLLLHQNALLKEAVVRSETQQLSCLVHFWGWKQKEQDNSLVFSFTFHFDDWCVVAEKDFGRGGARGEHRWRAAHGSWRDFPLRQARTV